ncbi:MAG: polysulfide reductase NrfD [Desulfuromonadaceae bacterium]|nr:polysulfide reductase NrfD [Desulfuromonadaceae bacterium]MDD5106737.1 polysulfide reductase NrfD [Desulfuromonadaceae bacterium]
MANGAETSVLALTDLYPMVTTRLRSATLGFYTLLLSCGVLFLVAAGLGIHAMVAGHDKFYNVYREVPWGILISTYVFFVVTSTGLCLVSSIGHVFGNRDFMPIAKRSVFLSIATILSGFFVIAFEIKIPWRMAIYNIISPNLTSNIWWMGTLYGIYLVFMFAEYVFLLMDKHKPAVFCGFSGSVAGIAAHSNLGAVFGLLMGREFWHGPYMPIYFIASAMMTGCSVIILFHCLGYKVNGEEMPASMKNALRVTAKLGVLLISVIMFFTTWKMITGLAGRPAGKYEAVMALLNGPYALNFWVFEVGLGMVFPLVMFVRSKGENLKMMLYGAIAMIVGIFVMRYDLVVMGQLVPVFHELGVNEYKHLLSYTPSLYETIITLGGFGLTAFLFLLGEKLFAGHKVEEHTTIHESIDAHEEEHGPVFQPSYAHTEDTTL